MFELILGVLVGVAALIVAYFWWSFQYWKRRGVPHETPKYFSGNLSPIHKTMKSLPYQLAEYYKRMKAKGHKYAGFYTLAKPNLLILDPVLVKAVLSKDFCSFMNRGLYCNEKDEPLSGSLVLVEGKKWRQMRTKLTPAFSSGKLKTTLPTLVACAAPLKKRIAELVSAGEQLDIRELSACYSTDVIGNCAFGVECNSFAQDPAEFLHYGKLLFAPSRMKVFRQLFVQSFPQLGLALGMKMINPEVHAFFMDLVRRTVEHREKHSSLRKDFLQVLVDMKSSFTVEEKAAQAFLFFEGYRTSTTGMTFCLYELACHQDIQDKVRREIETVLSKHNGEATYEALQEMVYLEQVINETFRMFPPGSLLSRVCNETYTVPNEDLVIEKGTRVFISAWGLHRDSEFYPEPDKFNPDRFAPENKDALTPFTFLPFGEGPRICIGIRFGMMQIMVGLISILRHFRVKPSATTPKEMTLDRLNSQSSMATPKETLYLTAESL